MVMLSFTFLLLLLHLVLQLSMRDYGIYMYEIKLSDNHIVRRHVNHIRTHESDCGDVSSHEEVDDVPIPVIQPTPVNGHVSAPVSVELCHSQRVRKPLERFQS